MNHIPGYKSMAAFGRKYGLDRATVRGQLIRGHCAWPRKRTTGARYHILYGMWATMKSRCYNANVDSYSGYGARGIQVCPSWRYDFWQFVADMGERPEGFSIERIDNDGNYEPSNCKWASDQEQASNKRTYKSNQTGVPGVFLNKHGSFVTRINVEGVRHYIGSYRTLEEAKHMLKRWEEANES